tara:strand:- start:5554 stop:6516 length:963 start_codon:yes stop_codon:yes gene_type:complete
VDLSLLILVLALGFAVLLGGGEALVRGATRLSRSLQISPLIIGLTVVAFGTSLPEFAVNLIASVTGSTEMAFGNVMGSNMANIGLIAALTALVLPLKISPKIATIEMPFLFLLTSITLILAFFPNSGKFGRVEGVVLVGLLIVFLYRTIKQGRNDPKEVYGRQKDSSNANTNLSKNIGFIIVGAIALILGAELIVFSGQGLAEHFGIRESIIGLAVLAVGTSLPELTASLVSAFRGHPDLAVGNIIGSNVLNLAFVLGFVALVHPVDIPSHGGITDIVSVLFLTFILWAIVFWRSELRRSHGLFLLVFYIGYIGWRVSGT